MSTPPTPPADHLAPEDRLLPRLHGVETIAPGKWLAYCPVHEADGGTHNPSLHIDKAADGKLLLHCFACPATGPQICMAVGLTQSELYPDHGQRNGRAGGGGANRKGRPQGKKVAEYEYRDSDGVLVYVARRYETDDGSKTFVAGRYDQNKKFIPNLRGVQRVLYRLPELIAAGAADKANGGTPRPVYIAEGEKKVDALARWGLTATCNLGGAGKWNRDYAPFFRGRKVVILPDNDPTDPETGRNPGLDHARKILDSLAGIAESVHVLELPGLPPKGDVIDWIAAGGTLPQLLELTAAVQAGPQTELPKAEPIAETVNPNEITNASGFGDEVFPIPMSEILARINSITDGWPRRMGSALFVHETEGAVNWLPSPASLFGYLGTKAGIAPRFYKKTGCHTKEEVFCEIQRTSKDYAAVEVFPHEPPMAGHYYACKTPEPTEQRTAIQGLINFFAPETPIDEDLIMAMFATMFWGGPGGTRPAFVITSDDGRGAGKTKMAVMATRLVDGFMEISANENIETIKTRLLSKEGGEKRVALLDNVKTLRFSWAELEALITGPTISGKRMYVGEGSRPNTLTWIITLNGVSLSTDMAQRAAVIKIRRPKHSGDWEADVSAYIAQHKAGIIGDLIAFLKQEPYPLERYTRWGLWERAVLSRFPCCQEIQQVIADRQSTSNVEDEEAGLIEEHFQKELEELGYSPLVESIFIPSRVACEWYNRATNEKHSTTGSTRSIKQKVQEKTFRCIKLCANRHHGRGFVWQSETHDPELEMHFDIESRIELNKERWRRGF